jgi:hypothetical protein
MAKQAPCRDCSETVEVSPDKIQQMLQILVKSRKVELADEETSRNRLAQCTICPAYALGGTCMYCGCLVEIRTKIAGQHCPYPLKPKW